jgi:hypothetical protein
MAVLVVAVAAPPMAVLVVAAPALSSTAKPSALNHCFICRLNIIARRQIIIIPIVITLKAS